MSIYNVTPIVKQKFVSLHIMKGLAILLVILVHTSQRIQGDMYLRPLAYYGQMGVQIFFIVSAFTLCYSMEYRGKSDTFKGFYLRRYSRIAPGYYFGIILYLILTSFFSGVWVSDKNPVNIIVNLLFLNGFYPPANNTVVPGGWSIGTEMIFYLLFPFLFRFYMKLQKKYEYTYLALPAVALLFSLLVQAVIFSLTNEPAYFKNNSFIYYSILNQLPVFCTGISLYIAFRKGLTENVKKLPSVFFFGLFTLFSAFLLYFGHRFFLFSSALFPFLSGISYIFVFTYLQNNQELPGRTRLAKIGKLSYSSYLVHFIFTFYFVTGASSVFDFVQADIRLIVLYTITVILTLFLARFVHKYIEPLGTKFEKRRSLRKEIEVSEKESAVL